jgi:pSer/pThr/pTyr-binding forkhead associated (FHA) protein
VTSKGQKDSIQPLGRLGGKRDDLPAFAIAHGDDVWPIEEGRELLMGRSLECQIIIDAAAVSRKHARLWTRGRDILVEDLGSRHGVHVNAVKITEPTLVKLGDRIVLGDTVLSIVRARTAGDPSKASSRDTPVLGTEPVPVTDMGLDSLAVFAKVAGRAMGAGRTRQATMVAQHLFESMIGAGPSNEAAVAQIDEVCDLFSWICVTTQEPEWVDRIFELRLAFRSRMSEAKLRALAKIARDVPVPPHDLRHAYLAWMHTQTLTPSERNALADLTIAGS